jgi:predicted lactoylglutathione lyase
LEQRFTLVTLGVTDLGRAVGFYERLGWRRAVQGAEGVAFFQCGDSALALYPLGDLARDAGLAPARVATGAVSIALNVRSRAAVDAALGEAAGAGASVVKPAAETAWGGYVGYFQDPDGHLWEIAWNPAFALDASGAVSLPP